MQQSGNVLFLILIAVVLFAALSYAVTKSSSGGGGNISREQAKLDQAELENYLLAVHTGVQRLTIVRGCESVDFTPPADWVAGDKSCHLFHPDGARVSYRDMDFDFFPDGSPTTDLGIGQSCGSIVHIGESGGNRIYAALADNGSIRWGPISTTTGATSTSDGLANTDDLIAYDLANGTNHPAAQSCRGLGPKWYLPADDELNLLWANRASFDLVSLGIDVGGTRYWSSRAHSGNNARRQQFNDGSQDFHHKNDPLLVRCFRRD